MAREPKQLPRGIDRQSNGMYRGRVYYQGKQYMIGAFYTLGDAKAAMSIARSEIARKVFVPPSLARQERAADDVLDRIAATTVSEWADDWIARLESMNRTPATLRSYRSTLDAHVVPALGSLRLVDVTPEHIDAMLDTLKGKPGAWTNAARVTRSLFLAAVSAGAGGLTASPFQAQVPSTRRAAKRSLSREDVATPAQVRQLADAMPAELRLAVLLAAWCAMRQGEVLGLQRRDFSDLEDPERATVHIARQWNQKATPPAYTPPKAGSERIVAIPAALAPAILRHLEDHTRAEPDAPVFPRRGPSRLPVSQTALDAAWRAAREPILPGFRFHSLRHTGLTEYAKTGATIAEIQARGGHSSVDVALRYQHATRERDRANVARMPVDIGGDREGD